MTKTTQLSIWRVQKNKRRNKRNVINIDRTQANQSTIHSKNYTGLHRIQTTTVRKPQPKKTIQTTKNTNHKVVYKTNSCTKQESMSMSSRKTFKAYKKKNPL